MSYNLRRTKCCQTCRYSGYAEDETRWLFCPLQKGRDNPEGKVKEIETCDKYEDNK